MRKNMLVYFMCAKYEHEGKLGKGMRSKITQRIEILSFLNRPFQYTICIFDQNLFQ